MRTHLVELDHLSLSEKSDHLMADIEDLHFAIDNHLPRKNAGKPKRGFFDVGHLDVTSNMQLRILLMSTNRPFTRLWADEQELVTKRTVPLSPIVTLVPLGKFAQAFPERNLGGEAEIALQGY